MKSPFASLLILLALAACQSPATETEEESVETAAVIPHIKKRTLYLREGFERLGTDEHEHLFRSEAFFDSNNVRIKEIHYHPNSDSVRYLDTGPDIDYDAIIPQFHGEQKMDSLGRLIYNENERQKVWLRYDSIHGKLAMYSVNLVDTFWIREERDYNPQGKLIETRIYNEQDSLQLSFRHVFEYDKHGNRLSKIIYYGNGDPWYRFFYEYNEYNHLIKERWYLSNYFDRDGKHYVDKRVRDYVYEYEWGVSGRRAFFLFL